MSSLHSCSLLQPSHLPGSLWQPTAWASCSCHGSLYPVLSLGARTIFSRCHSDHIISPLSPLFSRSQSQRRGSGPQDPPISGSALPLSFLSSHPSGPYSDAIYVASHFSFLHRTLEIHILLIFLKRHIWCLATKHTFFCQHIWCLATTCETLTFPPG